MARLSRTLPWFAIAATCSCGGLPDARAAPASPELDAAPAADDSRAAAVATAAPASPELDAAPAADGPRTAAVAQAPSPMRSPVGPSERSDSPTPQELPLIVMPTPKDIPLIAMPAALIDSASQSLPIRPGDVVSPRHAAGRPIAISIPSIGVDSRIEPTGFTTDGAVDVPADASVAGWFEPGPRPGERGPAVVMGHVDSFDSGPGVFFHLRDVELGAIVTIATTGEPVRFVVRSVEQYSKEEFPTERIYGAVPGVELRLITCGGSFDRSARSYRDNIVVFLTPYEEA